MTSKTRSNTQILILTMNMTPHRGQKATPPHLSPLVKTVHHVEQQKKKKKNLTLNMAFNQQHQNNENPTQLLLAPLPLREERASQGETSEQFLALPPRRETGYTTQTEGVPSVSKRSLILGDMLSKCTPGRTRESPWLVLTLLFRCRSMETKLVELGE